MKIVKKEFGSYMTNCYIVDSGEVQIVIDPGVNAYEWVMKNTSNLKAVFNTHGHFDHVYDNYKFMNDDLEIYIHKDDSFMLKKDPFNLLKEGSKASFLAQDKDEFRVGEILVKFHHFPGHTPGCCILEVACNGKKAMFSGDFLFKNTIGRYDFPFSNSNDMRDSLLKVAKFKDEMPLYPGHGENSTLQTELKNIEFYLARM
ncbi:MBL fold metallo-hydrolase [Campylobacter sp. FMV-PI01]|uniref:MBL fold metallo-hydrolase n=1 Tax=Campylobacter portucalensis TaxID=2608384 RepID=A0A6L5WJG4_9BACT|nr:MBL fold metallo-hydrolase [Campylobacter portucalensis]MSN97086.1 MBL fold metallo-hydrolase [Campylobacter portucalensis]